ncbi:MAG: FecR domain-containing protein [Candidatus Uhrbacteria bacterium]|nr:FecR domain-containing protein [Candidatus Uhrbacteria bacterium]
MKKWIFIVLPLLVLAGLVWWFWSLGSVPEYPKQSVTLMIESQGVRVRRPQATIWEAAATGMEIGEGWSIQTDGTGLATIQILGQAESRVGHGSEVAITKVMVDPTDVAKTQIELYLASGRVWSRVLRLLDLNASFMIRTSSVVATVRGTAFDVSTDASGATVVSANDGAVMTMSAKSSGATDAVPAGTAVAYRADGTVAEKNAIANDVKTSDWVMRNELADDAFVAAQQKQRRQELENLGGIRPDQALASIAQLSENLHLTLTQENQRDALAQRYFVRRFFHLIELVEAGKTGLAAQEFARLESYIRTQLQGQDGVRERNRIRQALARIDFLVDQIDPNVALYPFKQRIENISELLVHSDEASSFFVRLLSLDARLDEANRLIMRKALEEARISLDGVRSGIENLRREVGASGISGDQAKGIQEKVSAVDAREKASRTALQEALRPEVEPANTTSTQTGTDALDGLQPDTSVTTSTDAEPEFTSIEASVHPNPIEVGSDAKIVVLAKRTDGTTKDVSALAQYTGAKDIVKMNGTLFTAIRAGTGIVTATYNDRGRVRTTTISLKTTGEARLESLILSSSEGIVLLPGGTSEISATAKYNNGDTKLVTKDAHIVVASGAGVLDGVIFTAPTTKTSVSELGGSFTENGVTVVGTLKITSKR